MGSICEAARRHPRLPICVFADDAHFSDPDPDTVDLLKRLLDAARADRWPMLLVVTHWQNTWNADASAVARWLKPQVERLAVLPLGKLRSRTLAPLLMQYFPGLLTKQTETILDRADGNPQFLEEIVKHMDINRRLFVNLDKTAPLTDQGFAEITHLTVERHRLNTRRFLDLPDSTRAALAIGSLQGQRLLEDLTLEVCAVVGYPDTVEVQRGIGLAEMPHSLIKREGAWAEFLQQLYREIAERDLPNVADHAEVRAGIVAALRRRIDDPGALFALSPDDRLATLGIAWTVLRDAPDDEATIAAIAAAMLIEERVARREFLGAGAQAQALVDAMRARTVRSRVTIRYLPRPFRPRSYRRTLPANSLVTP